MARNTSGTTLRVLYLLALLGVVAGARYFMSSGLDWAPAAYRIPAEGRLRLEQAELPEAGPVILLLDMTDIERGSGNRRVRVVAPDGRRLETTSIPVPGRDAGVRVEIDRDFLVPGLYMVQIDSAEDHPLSLRRYVFELK